MRSKGPAAAAGPPNAAFENNENGSFRRSFIGPFLRSFFSACRWPKRSSLSLEGEGDLDLDGVDLAVLLLLFLLLLLVASLLRRCVCLPLSCEGSPAVAARSPLK